MLLPNQIYLGDCLDLMQENVLSIAGNVRIERDGAKVFFLQISGKQALKLFKLMQKINTIKLKRKWENPQILELIEKMKIFDYNN